MNNYTICRLLKYFIIFSLASQSFGMTEKYVNHTHSLNIITIQPQYMNDDMNDDMNTVIDHGENYMK